MPLIAITRYNNYHHHHHHPEVSEQLCEILDVLAQMKEIVMSLPKEVQDLLDQAKKNNSVLQSMDLHYNALATLVGTLQTTINGLKAGTVLSDVDKAALMAQTSDLAAVATTAAADIVTNTQFEGQTVDPQPVVAQPVTQPVAEPGSGSSSGTTTDPAIDPSNPSNPTPTT